MHTALLEAGQLTQYGGILEHATFQRDRVYLVKIDAAGQQRLRLLPLAAQILRSKLLHFVRLRLDLPVGRVDVAPFGAHDRGIVGGR